MAELLGLNDLLKSGDETYQQRFKKTLSDEEIDVDYSKGIPVARKIETGEIVSIKPDETTRIGLFGPSGSGKTTLAKAFLSRAYKAGFKVVHGSDVKNDFQSFNYEGGASQELVDSTQGFLRGEEPESIERILAIPHFLLQHYESRPEYGTVFSVDISDLTESEFKFLIGYHDWRSSTAQETLDTMLMDKDLGSTSLSELERLAEEQGKSNLVRKIRSLKSKGLLETRAGDNLRSVLADFEEVGVLSLGLKGWRNYLNGQEHFFQFYSAKLLRELREMMRSGDVSAPVIVFEDEFHSLAPQGRSSMVKEEFQDLYDRAARQLGITTVISAQRSSQLPNPDNDDDLDFVSDLTDVFLMRGKPTPAENDWKPVVRALGVYDGRGGDELNVWKDKINSLSRFQGIYVNSELHDGPGDCPVVESLSPLVSHPS